MQRLRSRFTVLALLAVALTGCTLQTDLADRSLTAGLVTPSPAPPLSGETVAGGRLNIASLRGHVVVVDFWASWCGPCRKEQPELNALAATYSPRNVRFIGVDIRDDRASARGYISDLHVPYPSVFDPASATTEPWGVAAPPTIIVVDGQGQIRARLLGTLDGLTTLLNTLH